MGEVNQSNVHLLLPWKVAGFAALWAEDLGISRIEAQRRFYETKFYRDLEDESTKLWTLSPEQLYLIFHATADLPANFKQSGVTIKVAVEK